MDRLDARSMALPGVEVRVVERCGSTNTVLLSEKNPFALPVLLAAETQTAGRGRRGRHWQSDPGGGITFSLGLRIARAARELAALSLVAGVATARALRALGIAQAALKWPNDLEAGGAKLGGILVETRGWQGAERSRGSLAVIGIGINYRPDAGLERSLRRRIACVSEFVSPPPPRDRIIQAIAAALLEALEAFEAGGLDALRDEWLALHAHAGQRLRVRLTDGRMLTGIAAGLAEDGGLQLQTRSGLRAIRSGRVVSARIAPAARARPA
jgi:BirA family transcriptional regulator, biotin operon repressor / biotin---[acetyl-CoA-carboxylase] ligase